MTPTIITMGPLGPPTTSVATLHVASIKGASVVCQIEKMLILSETNSLFGAYHFKGWDSSGS